MIMYINSFTVVTDALPSNLWTMYVDRKFDTTGNYIINEKDLHFLGAKRF